MVSSPRRVLSQIPQLSAAMAHCGLCTALRSALEHTRSGDLVAVEPATNPHHRYCTPLLLRRHTTFQPQPTRHVFKVSILLHCTHLDHSVEEASTSGKPGSTVRSAGFSLSAASASSLDGPPKSSSVPGRRNRMFGGDISASVPAVAVALRGSAMVYVYPAAATFNYTYKLTPCKLRDCEACLRVLKPPWTAEAA